MSSQSPGQVTFDPAEPIPGYRSVSLLGRGGFGEVWQAIAPGGIGKAIKIVYGDKDAANMELEQRAINRIKDVRHPLLLSIERIEVVAGNLVIVTELADYSLKQHFQSLHEAGKTGIPQEELLKYLTDVAEVLDFIYSEYSLQHLDVKPENILVVGRRAKMGDFGLVKNLYERSMSFVDGLTPTYAPPELFEGKPDRHSDQYSLALVYMQMLTGELPFVAKNTAQIAAQHLQGVPDLSALPKHQRQVIARALSKDPSLRFENCTALMTALKDAVHKPETPSTSNRVTLGACAAPDAPTLSRSMVTRVHAASILDEIEFPEPPVAQVRVPQPVKIPQRRREVAVHDASQGPVLLIGVGGLGVSVLASLVDRLNDRFGAVDNWPPLEILALDSNTRRLSASFRLSDLDRVRVVPIPLHSAESYSSDANRHLRWLHRRWYYNIPRDHTTGGFRPLGRLALLSNARRVRDEITEAISRLARQNAGLKAAAQSRDLPACEPPRVLLIGSISGGTGSGSLLDLSYAVRSELSRQGFSDELVEGLLLHATPRSQADRDKARANAYAMLSELDHYGRPGSYYPGEPLLNAEPFHGNNATFSEMHLMNLGDGVEASELSLAAEEIAEFVYGVSCTAARNILARTASDSATDTKAGNRAPQLHSYQVMSLGAGNRSAISVAIQLAQQDVLKLWREGQAAPVVEAQPEMLLERTERINTSSMFRDVQLNHADQTFSQQFAQFQLDLPSLLSDAKSVLKQEIGKDHSGFVAQLVEAALSGIPAKSAAPLPKETILQTIDHALVTEPANELDLPGQDQLFRRLVERLNECAGDRIRWLMDSIRAAVDNPALRIDGARRQAVIAHQSLQSTLSVSSAKSSSLNESLVATTRSVLADTATKAPRKSLFSWGRSSNPISSEFRSTLKQYTEISVNNFLHRVVIKTLRIIATEVTNLIEQLDRLGREIARMPDLPHTNPGLPAADECLPASSNPAIVAYHQLLVDELERRRDQIAVQIDEKIRRSLSSAGIGIHRFLDADCESRPVLWQPLQEMSKHAVMDCVADINAQFFAECCTNPGATEPANLAATVAAELTKALAVSPADNALRVLIVPEKSAQSLTNGRLANLLNVDQVIPGHQCDITFCAVRPSSSIEQAANSIIEGIPVYRELASRLYTRVDIHWEPFKQVAVPNFADSVNTGSLAMDCTQRLPCP